MDKQGLLDCWIMFRREHDVSVDRMICDPELRSEFLKSVKSISGDATEEQILWALMGLRKRKEISRRSKTPADE